MPHSMVGQGYSNADVAKEPALYASQGNIVFSGIQAYPVQLGKSTAYQDLPSFKRMPEGLTDLSDELSDQQGALLNRAVAEDLKEEVSSDGTSSSTSAKKRGWSGSTARETDQLTQSPAQYAENPFEQDPQVNQAQSSTAPSTDGSTPETGLGQQSPQASSAEDTQVLPATPATTEEKKTADEMLHLAREAFDAEDYDMADELLDEADLADPELKDQIAAARAEILKLRAGSKKK
jgi:hypothetical protein